jgi:long-subunit fatty acid transport protein
MISNSVKALSPDSPKGQSIGAGLDLGFMWEMSDRIRYGLLFRGVPAINSWKNRATEAHYYEAHPTTLTMGGSYRASYSSFFVAEGQIPLYEDQPWIMAGGIEYEFFRMIALRVGLQREILDEESNWWKITGGAGFRFDTEPIWGKSLNLDVSYEYNTLHLFPVINVSLRLGF